MQEGGQLRTIKWPAQLAASSITNYRNAHAVTLEQSEILGDINRRKCASVVIENLLGMLTQVTSRRGIEC